MRFFNNSCLKSHSSLCVTHSERTLATFFPVEVSEVRNINEPMGVFRVGDWGHGMLRVPRPLCAGSTGRLARVEGLRERFYYRRAEPVSFRIFFNCSWMRRYGDVRKRDFAVVSVECTVSRDFTLSKSSQLISNIILNFNIYYYIYELFLFKKFENVA